MQEKTLNQLIDQVLAEMSSAGFADGTQRIYKGIYKRLQLLAEKEHQVFYTSALGAAYINDNAYAKGGGYCHSRYCYHNRCIQFIESLINTGIIDWSINRQHPAYKFSSVEISKTYNNVKKVMVQKGLKPNTIDGYCRFIRYFLQFLETKGYSSVYEIQKGEIIEFITLACTEHYQPTSLGAHMPGLKLLIESDKKLSSLMVEIPEHLAKKTSIIEVYSDAEYDKIKNYMANSSQLSYRNQALCILAIESGLRAVDICNLKISDIDWKQDYIHVLQEKTSKPVHIPLSEDLGNALVDYLLSERPESKSDYVFLKNTAPFQPITTHSGCRNIIRNIVKDAGIKDDGRIYGTRITRHSTASRMLRHGIPLPIITEALGHSSSNSTMVYITTDDEKMAECTLPLPVKKVIQA